MSKKYLSIFFIPCALAVLAASFWCLRAANQEKKNSAQLPIIKKYSPYNLFMAVPKVLGTDTSSINGQNGTSVLICEYLEKYHSPMVKTCESFSAIFEKNGIDPIFALAIAQCESNLGKKMPVPEDQNCFDYVQPGEEAKECCHNPFGWGCHSAGTLCFSTWEEGYESVALGLKKKYLDQGLMTVEEIMSKYNKTSAEERNGSWGKCVQQFVEEISRLNIR